ncbi:MAG: tRNA preQ1(34) S-adenosylmethionine ribosyltransferase-isomerase QueA [Syntrophomonadaceae bacterium]|jgi:S-adenosylmethionine:tRNA ribosyltransferase-isomerase|nr:tRNA preQ1(34) S-adenosylmethionine ribosyltransferase-isomerase QueA [Syntrophomonadaceae bacterium]
MTRDQDRDCYKLQNYHFHLPEELIAQYPVQPRDASRLLVLDRENGYREDRRFRDIVEYLQPGDTMVLNDTRVIPARLKGYKSTGAQVELLLLKKVGDNWEALVKPARRLKAGDKVMFDDSEVEVEILGELPLAGGRLLNFQNCRDEDSFLERIGHVPLPPYINREDEKLDVQRYQTVYARHRGSAAAPTAGLHFSSDLLLTIRERGVNIASIILHVGLGTFRPVSCTDIREHPMHSEYYEIDESCAQLLNATRAKGGKIIAVGTTVVRTLETVYNEAYVYRGAQGYTEKFIYPGYEIKSVDGMITNFHLPGSSLIMLVAAFGGLEHVLSAYRHAVNAKYRFFSYGDAMLIK